MTNPAKEKLEEPVRSTARGHDPATPVRALTGVTIVIGAVVLVLIVALLVLWYALK